MVDWWALAAMTRPPNVAIGVLGVVAGALAGFGLEASWGAVALTAVAAAFGMAGGNTLNDVLDASLDASAHPDRPIPSGRVSLHAAQAAAAVWFAVALGVALLVNPLVALGAALLATMLVAYETWFKRLGLLGNILVSVVVGSLFAVGALAAAGGPLAYDSAALGWRVASASWTVVLSMAVMAAGANTARELYKDLEDVEADRAHRRTFPMRRGAGATRAVAGGFLIASSLYALSLFYRDARFGDVYVLLALPAVLLFVLSMLAKEARDASRAVKLGMLFALAAFVSVGL